MKAVKASKIIPLILLLAVVFVFLIYQVFIKKTSVDYIKMLESDNPYERTEAAYELGEYNSKQTIEALKEALNDPHYEVRSSAIRSLAKTGDVSVLPILLKKVYDEHSWVRSSATRALRTMGGKKQIPLLLELLNDNDLEVRKEAIWALSAVAGSSALPIFREEIKKQDGTFKRILKYESFKLGDKNYIPFVINKIEGNRFEKEKSLELLNNYIVDINFGSNSTEWLNWWEENKDDIIWDGESKKYRIAKGSS